MTSSPIRTLLICAAIAGGAALYLSTDEDATTSGAEIMSNLGIGGHTQDESPASAPSTPAKTSAPRSASVVSLPRQQGQFYAQARVNRGHVRFLVDTGASSVALTLDDARRAGIDTTTLRYTVPVSTANGRTYAAGVMLDEVSIGGIRLRQVQGLVVKEGLHISLLGMTFLGELQKVEATPTQLIMRL